MSRDRAKGKRTGQPVKTPRPETVEEWFRSLGPGFVDRAEAIEKGLAFVIFGGRSPRRPLRGTANAHQNWSGAANSRARKPLR